MNNDKREKEDATKYGEFVSSYFSWISPEKQKSANKGNGRKIFNFSNVSKKKSFIYKKT